MFSFCGVVVVWFVSRFRVVDLFCVSVLCVRFVVGIDLYEEFIRTKCGIIDVYEEFIQIKCDIIDLYEEFIQLKFIPTDLYG